jgi:hypothetical protein
MTTYIEDLIDTCTRVVDEHEKARRARENQRSQL